MQEVKFVIKEDHIGGALHSIPETLMEDYQSSAIVSKVVKDGDDPANMTALQNDCNSTTKAGESTAKPVEGANQG